MRSDYLEDQMDGVDRRSVGMNSARVDQRVEPNLEETVNYGFWTGRVLLHRVVDIVLLSMMCMDRRTECDVVR